MFCNLVSHLAVLENWFPKRGDGPPIRSSNTNRSWETGRDKLRLAGERRLEREKGFGCGLRCSWESLPESQEISLLSFCFPLAFDVSANVMLRLWVALTSNAGRITCCVTHSLIDCTLRLVKSAGKKIYEVHIYCMPLRLTIRTAMDIV